MLWTDGFSIEATILLLYAMMEISPQDLLLLLGHTAQGLGPGKDTFLKLTQGPKWISQALFLQRGLHTTKLGAAGSWAIRVPGDYISSSEFSSIPQPFSYC